jgi:uracil-DNA glycosylase
MTVLVGGYAHKYHMGVKTNVTDTVAGWRAHAPQVFALPHPSWRNTAWLKKNPWFEAELLPELRDQVQKVMHDR